jgi:Txe/YoeB family toxin of toxin-antitoxin system
VPRTSGPGHKQKNARRSTKCARNFLKFFLAGAWSRRIDEEHRLVYLVDDKDIIVLQARYHYE